MSSLVLGLDLGPNSIGWALIDEKNQRIVDLGVRVFPEGVDNFDTSKEVSRNEARRLARGMRRQSQRRSRRKRLLRASLVDAGLLPADPTERKELFTKDPYELRARALSEELEPYELGRIFAHLAQRRGFLSNRKKDRGDKEVKGMLAQIEQLRAQMGEAAGEHMTLGQLLNGKLASLDHKNRREGDHVRNRHTAREMYKDEFEQIWEAQCRLGNAELLTDRLKYGAFGKQEYPCRPRPCSDHKSLLEACGIHGLIFFQRTMYWPKSAIGLCELEPKQPRCPRADRRAQRFRLLHEVNNLRYLDLSSGTREECRLDAEQRTLLLARLGTSEKMTFDQIRKALGFLDSVKFNLEKGKRPYLLGQVVDVRMSKAVGEAWHGRPEEEKDEIVRVLIDNERDDDTIIERAQTKWGLTPEQAEAALNVDFPPGYLHLSLRAINRLLPHMQEKGLVYQSVSDPEQSAIHAAGYLRRDELQRRLFDRLPDPGRTRDCPIGDIPNPVVKRALVELRKLVNGILREHGKPAEIHVEMGRDVKTRPHPGTEAYFKYHQQITEMRELEQRHERAREQIREAGFKPTREARIRYLLWEDQNRTCIYSGQPISVRQLFGGEVDIDHILPYSRCLDDSQNNKVVCFRQENHEKGDKTPYEWLAATQPERYEQICQRGSRWMKEGRFRYVKYRRLLQKELELDDFIDRQLNDSRYIARATGEYLKCLFDADLQHQVLGLKGQLTAELRWQWGIETVLSELPDSPAWQEQSKLRPGEKNRADHRHHVIDAVVIALTNRSRLQELSRIRRAGGTKRTGEILLDPWPSFRDDVEAAVSQISVSHRAERKVRGLLHEATFYGSTEQDGHWVSRKPVEALSSSEIEHIRDLGIQRIVVDRLREHGVEYGRGKKIDAKVLADLKMPSGVPIKKVRVVKPEATIQPIRQDTPNEAYVKPGSTHHLCIFEFEEDGKMKREAVFVTMLEAADRLKRREPVIQRQHPSRPDARFIMSLSRGEMVLADWKGEKKLLVFRTAASTTQQMTFVEHTDARRSSDAKPHTCYPSTFAGRKVTVDPLGRVRWAND